MKTSGLWIVGALLLLIVIAILVASRRPVELTRFGVAKPLRENPMPLVGKEPMPSLPVLAESMPPFLGITRWWHTPGNQPLSPEDLKGKVVLIDFWTYSCINCIRTQPVLRRWWDTYKDDGLVIVGVHTPEFAFEKDPENVDDAIRRARLEFPIALDPDYATWNAYRNRYWPAEYFFDRQGRLRYTHFGEGNYDESEAVIRALLAEGGELTDAPTGADTTPAFKMTKTPETYFGYGRTASFANRDEQRNDVLTSYALREVLRNQWSVGGLWRIEVERAVSEGAGNRFRMNVESNAMHLVLGSSDGARRVRVRIDGADPHPDHLTDDARRMADGSVFLTVGRKDLYRIARFPTGGRHVVELELQDPGVEFYAATFGE